MAVQTSSPDQPAGDAGGGTTQALERGLSILTALGAARRALGLIEIAQVAQLSKSTAHRYVTSLVRLGFVEQEPDTRRYRLGAQALALGYAAIGSLELTAVAGRPLQALADETGYTANLAVLDGAHIVYVDRRRPTRVGFRIEPDIQVGTRLPAYCTSMGKVLLAHRSPAAVRDILDRTDLVRRGPRTITAREQLTSALADVASTGLAVNDEELAPGLRSLATPIRDRTGQVPAALSIAVHLSAWHTSMDAVVAKLEAPLRRTAAEISHRLGHVGPTDVPVPTKGAR